MERCTKCEDTGREYFLTAYGDLLCENCWEDYLSTEEGKVEYFIGISKGDYSPSDYDAEFLGETILSWQKNRDRLSLELKDIERIEKLANQMLQDYFKK